MKTLTPKQTRKLINNKYGHVAMVAFALSGSGLSVTQVVHAQDTGNDKEATQSTDTKISNTADLDKAVADAKKAGVQVTEKPANVKLVSQDELAKAKADAEADYKNQISNLQKQAKAQEQSTANYNALNKKYEDAKNKYAGKTPVSDKTVGGTRVRVYGDYDESKKGSVDYYSKFEAIFDTQPGDKTKIFSHSGWLDGAKLTRVSGSDKKAYTLDEVKKTYPNLKGADMQYYKNLRKGDVLKISEGKGGATDAITGGTYDLYLKVKDAPSTGTQFVGLKQGAGHSIVFDFTGSTGVNFDFEFVPKGKEYKPENVVETVVGMISYDIDANQAGQTDMMNAGVLNPKNSDVKVFDGNKYENISGDGYSDEQSIPGGSIGMYGKAKTFNWQFYANKNERAIKDRAGADQYAARFGVLGDAVKLNAIVKPVKPQALKADVQKTEIKLKGDINKPVKALVDEAGNVVTDTKVKPGDTVSYGLTDKVPIATPKGDAIKDYALVDPYIDVYDYKSSILKLTDAKGNDITSDWKTEDKKGAGVVWTPKDPQKYAGKQIYAQPSFTIKQGADLSKYEKDGKLVFPNSVYALVNGEKIPGNTVEVTPVGKTTPLEKMFVGDISKWNLHKINVDENASDKADGDQTDDAKTEKDSEVSTGGKASEKDATKESSTEAKSSSDATSKASSSDKASSNTTAEQSSAADKATSETTDKKTATVATESTQATSESKNTVEAGKSDSSAANGSVSSTDEKTDTQNATDETKSGETKDSNDKATTVNQVRKGQKYGYTLNTTIDAIDEDGKYIKSFSINDPLEKALAVDGAQIIDRSDKDKDITDDFKFDGKVKATVKADKLAALRGHKVEMRLGVHVDEKQDLSAYKQEDGSYLIKNVAEKEQNGKKTPSNHVDVKLDKDPEKPVDPKKPADPKQPEAPAKDLQAPNTGTTNPMTAFVDFVKGLFK